MKIKESNAYIVTDVTKRRMNFTSTMTSYYVCIAWPITFTKCLRTIILRRTMMNTETQMELIDGYPATVVSEPEDLPDYMKF